MLRPSYTKEMTSTVKSASKIQNCFGARFLDPALSLGVCYPWQLSILNNDLGHQDPIGHPVPSPHQPRALNSSQNASLSDLSPFTSAILWSRGKKDQIWQQVVFAKTGRPPTLGHGEEISIVVSCSYYSSYSYFSPCSSYVLLSPGQLQI